MIEDSRLAELLDRWEEAEDLGTPLSAEELCADCPELLGEFKRQIAALKAVDARLRTQDEDTPDGATDDGTDVSTDTLTIQPEFAELKFLAKGGLGAVYVAVDGQLHRNVALKFIRRRLIADTESRERFLLEAEITGRLEHPGVVPVYGIGTSGSGRPFYAMRFIEGETLEAAIERYHGARRPEDLEFHGLLHRFAAVSKTIAYAHNRGIIHRDVKPENVMLGRYGETLIVDWGWPSRSSETSASSRVARRRSCPAAQARAAQAPAGARARRPT